ncbi:MAG: hypothetical protein IJP14_02550 [Clostridia bacterium]|nr:hypothetical protein [Clostridia bacterium]
MRSRRAVSDPQLGTNPTTVSNTVRRPITENRFMRKHASFDKAEK